MHAPRHAYTHQHMAKQTPYPGYTHLQSPSPTFDLCCVNVLLPLTIFKPGKKKVHISREFVVKQQGGENKRAPANEASNRCHFCTGSESTPSSHQLFFSPYFFFFTGKPRRVCPRIRVGQ